jgi:tetratricopeptide (TPR) repeat protein
MDRHHCAVPAGPDGPNGRKAANEALAAARQAVALAPQLGIAHATLAEVLSRLFFDFAAAAPEYRRALELSPGDARVLTRASIYLAPRIEHSAPALEENDQWCLALAYDKLGRRAQAEAALTALQAAASNAWAYQYAQIYAQWGNTRKALDWLDKAYQLKDPGLIFLKMDSLLDPLRQEPGFQAIYGELNFPP